MQKKECKKQDKKWFLYRVDVPIIMPGNELQSTPVKPWVKLYGNKSDTRGREVGGGGGGGGLSGCTANTKNPNLKKKITRKGISGSQSQFPHSCLCERFI